ncbi:TRAP transporter small permease subunit [Myxococcota bacterium]|nr:TRAP transporter small permease subunit [Myxococcota bacterium]
MGARARLRRLDDGLFAVEKAGIVALTAAMGILVFLDVVHRVATRPEGPLVRIAARILGGGAAGGGAYEAHGTFLALALMGLVVGLAAATRGAAPARSAAAGLAGAAALGAALWAFVVALPNGLVWSQTLALALMLWVGMGGASLAARGNRHLGLDVGTKLWPEHKRHVAAALGSGVTTVVCTVLLWLSLRSVVAHYGDWQATQHAGGTLVGLPIPKWFAFLALPYGFSALAFRFGLSAWDAARGQVAEEESELDTARRQLGMDPGPGPAPGGVR